LTSVTYTSLARIDPQSSDLEAIRVVARERNAADGISGLLVFNGTHFLQTIEGSERAIDTLVERLRNDPRHTGFEVRDQRKIDTRSFPDWPMEMLRVNASYFEAPAASWVQPRICRRKACCAGVSMSGDQTHCTVETASLAPSSGLNITPAIPARCNGAGTMATPARWDTSATTESQCRGSWRTRG